MTFRLSRVQKQLLFVFLIALPPIGLCSENTVPANIRSVNYSGEEFEYWLEDPLNSKNRGSGESVEPYAASGIMCCYSLPKTWRNGLKVTIHSTYSFKKNPNSELSEVSSTQTVEVPPYVDGKVGEIWVVRAPDGALSLVSSDYEPSHPKWPGKMKGWPRPSVEYEQKGWDKQIELAENSIQRATLLIQKLNNNPDAQAKSAWDAKKQIRPESIAKFSGPDDIRFRAFLMEDYQRILDIERKELKALRERRP
jgi:hypothetical protein